VGGVTQESDFASALLAAELHCPQDLMAWNGSDPAQRFGVYRNNVMVSLLDALADTFAVTQELVGEEFFRAMARLHVQASPPQSPLLAFYGADFPDFIATFPPASGIAYLADVARLEYLRVLAYHAADATPLSAAEIGECLADAQFLSSLRLRLHPSLAVLASSAAVVSLWAAHQGVGDLAEVAPDCAETALVLRQGMAVEVMRIPAAAGCFIAAIRSGSRLGDAAEAAMALDEHFDLVDALGLLLHKSAITALIP